MGKKKKPTPNKPHSLALKKKKISKAKIELDIYIPLPGEGNDNPLQYSCLENSMDRGVWWATVHGIAKNQTRLSTQHVPHLEIVEIFILLLFAGL